MSMQVNGGPHELSSDSPQIAQHRKSSSEEAKVSSNDMLKSVEDRPPLNELSQAHVQPTQDSKSSFSEAAASMLKMGHITVQKTLKSFRNVTAKAIKSFDKAREQLKETVRTEQKASLSKPKTTQQIVNNHFFKLNDSESKLTPQEQGIHKKWKEMGPKERAFSPVMVVKNPHLREAMEKSLPGSKDIFTFTEGALELLNTKTPEAFEKTLLKLVKTNLHEDSTNPINFRNRQIDDLLAKMDIKGNAAALSFEKGEITEVNIKPEEKTEILSEQGMRDIKNVIKDCLSGNEGIDKAKSYSSISTNGTIGNFINKESLVFDYEKKDTSSR